MISKKSLQDKQILVSRTDLKCHFQFVMPNLIMLLILSQVKLILECSVFWSSCEVTLIFYVGSSVTLSKWDLQATSNASSTNRNITSRRSYSTFSYLDYLSNSGMAIASAYLTWWYYFTVYIIRRHIWRSNQLFPVFNWIFTS